MNNMRDLYLVHKKACTVQLASKIIAYMEENKLTLDYLDEVYDRIKEFYQRHALIKSSDMIIVDELSRETISI